jgi:hypothetical protein
LNLQCGEAEIASEPKQSTPSFAAQWIASLATFKRASLNASQERGSHAISPAQKLGNPYPTKALS